MNFKNKYIKYLIAIVILFLILFFLFNGCDKKENKAESKNETPLTFKDEVFMKMLQKTLDKEEIYQSDLDGYSGILIAADRLLSLSGNGKTMESVILFGFDSFEHDGKRYTEFGTIETLEDLKYFSNLSTVMVYLQPNIDFETIPNKDKIYNLRLSQNKINDISFLNGYAKLAYLGLSSNKIVNINGIENVKTLKNVSFNSNDIEDITLLSDLTNLEEIDLTYNSVTDLRPLLNLSKLEYLSLYENGLSDISPLAGVKSLKELYLNNNSITDISPLSDFNSFDALNVSGNPITNFEPISHITNVVK